MLGETKALLPEENYRKIRFKKGGYWAQLLGIDAKSEDRTERQYNNDKKQLQAITSSSMHGVLCPECCRLD